MSYRYEQVNDVTHPEFLLKLTPSYQRQCIIHHNCHPEITLLQ